MKRGTSFEDLKSEWMNDPSFRDAYGEADLALRLGERLRQLRIGGSLSKSELGRRAGVTVAAISRAELGSPDVKLETLTRLSRALGATLEMAIVLEPVA